MVRQDYYLANTR